MKKYLICFMLLVGAIILNCSSVLAAEIFHISLDDSEILVNGNKISSNALENIYLSENMDNGGSSDKAKEANKEVKNVINILSEGIYTFSGTLSDGQIAVNSNKVNGEVIIELNNANITCKNAPAIFVYNIETKSDKCNVIIRTTQDSNNFVSGNIIKQSVIGWEDQSKLLYSVEKSYSDEGEYFERYKYDGAISSDISLTFEGNGTLTVESAREGVEVKRDITINSGNYVFNTTEDGINAAQDGESVITINGGKILINTSKTGPQGDGIDSNGYLYINGGEIYSFANPKTEDSGLDSDLGIYINGGLVVATGNMYDMVEKESTQNVIIIPMAETCKEGELIALVDKNDKPMIAFKTDRNYKILTISSDNLQDEDYKVYKGGKIDGESINGLYTKINSYEKGTEVEVNSNMGRFPGMGMDGRPDFMDDRNNIFMSQGVSIQFLVTLGVVLVLSVVIGIVLIKKEKGRVIIFIIGVFTGAFIILLGSGIYKNNEQNNILNKDFRNDITEKRIPTKTENLEI